MVEYKAMKIVNVSYYHRVYTSLLLVLM